MEKHNLTKEEEISLKRLIFEIEKGEIDQVQDLFMNCSGAFRFAKTHSVYVKDWEKQKNRMENNLKNNILPPNTSATFYEALIKETDRIIQKKLKMVQMLFESKFHESIFKYLRPDGKTKFLGIF